MLMIICLLCIMSPFILSEERCALVLGVEHGLYWNNWLSKIRCVENDTHLISDLFYNKGQCKQTKLLKNAEVSPNQIQNILCKEWANTIDLLIVYIVGHVISIKNENYLVLYQSKKNETDTMLNLNDLLHWIDSCSAHQVLICCDSHNILQTNNLFYSIHSKKNYCVIQSTSIGEQSYNRSGFSLFASAITMAFQGATYLGKTADINQDELVTISEFLSYIQSCIRLSGFNQRPRIHGKSNFVLYPVQDNKPALELIEPKVLYVEKENNKYNVKISGLLRHTELLQNVWVGDMQATVGVMKSDELKAMNLIEWNNVQWFTQSLELLPTVENIQIIAQDHKKKFVWNIKLPWTFRGWHNEWMPIGMQKNNDGTYTWKNDGAKMVYVPAGSATIGSNAQILYDEFHLLTDYLQTQLQWMDEDLQCRLTLLQGLEQCNHSVQQLAKKLQKVYHSTESWNKLQHNINQSPTIEKKFPKIEKNSFDLEDFFMNDDSDYKNQAEEKKQTIEKQEKENQETEQIEKDASESKEFNIEMFLNTFMNESDSNLEQDIDNILQTAKNASKDEVQAYIKRSYSLLKQCYADIVQLQCDKEENIKVLEYIRTILKDYTNFVNCFAEKRVFIPAFYIDCYEITERQYRKFCDETMRPYPPMHNKMQEPVTFVSWEDAYAYALWSGKQLPTSEVWEKAARTSEGYIYPWGNEQPTLERCNGNVPAQIFSFDENKEIFSLPYNHVMRVNSLPLSESKTHCFHLCGNVQEWCLNQSNFIKNSEIRAVKGGSFSSSMILLQSWFEIAFPPNTRRSDLGFRTIVYESSLSNKTAGNLKEFLNSSDL